MSDHSQVARQFAAEVDALVTGPTAWVHATTLDEEYHLAQAEYHKCVAAYCAAMRRFAREPGNVDSQVSINKRGTEAENARIDVETIKIQLDSLNNSLRREVERAAIHEATRLRAQATDTQRKANKWSH